MALVFYYDLDQILANGPKKLDRVPGNIHKAYKTTNGN